MRHLRNWATAAVLAALGAAGLWAGLRSGLQADPALKKTVMLLHTEQ